MSERDRGEMERRAIAGRDNLYRALHGDREHGGDANELTTPANVQPAAGGSVGLSAAPSAPLPDESMVQSIVVAIQRHFRSFGSIDPRRSAGVAAVVRFVLGLAPVQGPPASVAALFDGLDLADPRVADIVAEYISRRERTDEGIAVHALAEALARTERTYDDLAKRVLSLVRVETPLSFWLGVGAEIGERARAAADPAAAFEAAHATLSRQARPVELAKVDASATYPKWRADADGWLWRSGRQESVAYLGPFRAASLAELIADANAAQPVELSDDAIRDSIERRRQMAQEIVNQAGARATRAEHVRYCKARAREYLAAGDPQQAVTSMLSDLGKHEATVDLVRVMGPLGIFSTGSVEDARCFVEGFAE
jgi:hypothetical protein